MCMIASSGYLSAQTGDTDPCRYPVTVNYQEGETVQLCADVDNRLAPWYFNDFNMSCATDGGSQFHTGIIGTYCITVPCCGSDDGLVLAWTTRNSASETASPCVLQVQAPCCEGPDSDGDSVCDEVDCNPDDSSQHHRPGDPCDDGDPNTELDTYNDNCECVGITVDPSFCDDYYQPGDLCSDGNPLTIGDRYNDSCECVSEPLPCGDVVVDDGCPLTIDIIDDNCTVTHLPPDVDDGCDGTSDWFDYAKCEIMHEALPCDDGDALTIDYYNEHCECIGYEPCELDIIEWEKVIELLDGIH